jgi:hypothetical protein|tara:strand:+ start:1712 stop:1933 length:222 start_codon:yes stop_codon:yes gene_type:complete
MNDTDWQERTDAWVKAQHTERRDKEKKRRKKNPVKKNMDKFHRPQTHRDKTKYLRKDFTLKELNATLKEKEDG